MNRRSELTIVLMLVANIAGGMSRAAAQSEPYPRMAAINQYLMETKKAEIQLARSVPLSQAGQNGVPSGIDQCAEGGFQTFGLRCT